MIIIQITISIVLAVLILNFLLELIALGGMLIVIIIALVVVGLLLYWIGNNPVALGFVVLVAIGIVVYLLWQKRTAVDTPVRTLRECIRRRKSLGYDTTDLDEELSKTISEAAQAKRARSVKNNRPKTRRELGYTNDHDNA